MIRYYLNLDTKGNPNNDNEVHRGKHLREEML